ncbi:hypothetical protein Cob_v000712 [Colletotrichum orbiculare MAFF 240422]|uniref:Uncharacterized protein n=1 Tax=Colletotrichum orbiculare (strain 104-T / ATCC 96160 / CBS 514.97 / LARS 414 / MAFF 240422) TaxID=1213857 RepID=A0A484GBA9_COLOR|nr:hypothetical protein Cob_v000712 [Colletotrichum orbiculare MAFF 240422]
MTGACLRRPRYEALLRELQWVAFTLAHDARPHDIHRLSFATLIGCPRAFYVCGGIRSISSSSTISTCSNNSYRICAQSTSTSCGADPSAILPLVIPRPAPISPITPTLPPARLPDPVPPFAADRPVLTHNAQAPIAAAAALPPPRPEPIDFDSNPDVLALKSAISILQLQQKKATADVQRLNKAKNAAVQDPAAFIADLKAGRVHTEGDKLFPDSDDSDSDDDGAEGKKPEPAGGVKPEEGSASQAKLPEQPQKQEPKPWESLPKPQNVVRCPPINWSQYAVVGESLDKLHNEQKARPSQGAPATLGASGTYEFTGVPGGNQRPYPGVAAPYTPGKDRIDKKTKGGRR